MNQHYCLYLQNPDSLDSSILNTLSTLYPPFEVTAPTILSQLLHVIEGRYVGDSLQCLTDFLIPARRLLDRVRQAACVSTESCSLIKIEFIIVHFGWCHDTDKQEHSRKNEWEYYSK